jgi:hypothetical protein
MLRMPLPLCFMVGEREVSGETLHCDASASILILTSCSAQLGLELRSAYLSGEGRGEILVAESAVLGVEPAELGSRLLDEAGGALIDERRRLLYDHLQRLQDLAHGGGWALSFNGVEDAAAKLDPLAPRVAAASPK